MKKEGLSIVCGVFLAESERGILFQVKRAVIFFICVQELDCGCLKGLEPVVIVDDLAR
jgi:hypothetical protein